MLPRILSRVVGWAKAHHNFYSLEFEERGESLWAFMRTWEKGTFRRVAVDVVDRFTVDATHDVALLGSVVAAVGSSASLVAIFGGSHVLADTYRKYLGSGYSHKLVEYPIFDLCVLKRCLQKVSSSVFGSLDPFSMTEFIATRLKGDEHRDWVMSRSSLRLPSSPESSRCRLLLRSSATSWECGLSLWCTSRRLVEKLTATA